MSVTQRQIRLLIRETLYRVSSMHGKNAGVLLEELLRAEPDDIKKAAKTGFDVEHGSVNPAALMSKIEDLRAAVPDATGESGWMQIYKLPGSLQSIAGYMAYDLAATDVGCAAADFILALDELQKMLEGATEQRDQSVIDVIEQLKGEGRDHWNRVSNDFYAMADGDSSMREIRNTVYRHLTDDELFRIAQEVDEYFSNPQGAVQGTPLDDKDLAGVDYFANNNAAPTGHLALLAANDERNEIPGAYADVANLRRYITTKEQFAKFLKILVEVADEVVKPDSAQVFEQAIKDSMPPKWEVNFDFDFLKRRLAGTDRSSFSPGAVMSRISDMAVAYNKYYNPSTKFVTY